MNFFEQRILNAVTPLLRGKEQAEFFADSGCLFLTCGLVTLSAVVRTLSKIGAGNFKVSHVGDEFAIDFI